MIILRCSILVVIIVLNLNGWKFQRHSFQELNGLSMRTIALKVENLGAILKLMEKYLLIVVV